LAKALGTAEQINDRLLSRTALKRIAQPEEVSRVILFLLSEVSSYITSSVSRISFQILEVFMLIGNIDYKCGWRIPVSGEYHLIGF
jgi:NAD(P)-dependent dehydrogenase (short-subunit alcohol dehydrogenase family)